MASRAANALATPWSINTLSWASVTVVVVVAVAAGDDLVSMKEEEVSLVDGVFEGAFGALALEIEALVDAMEGFPKYVRAFWVRIAEASRFDAQREDHHLVQKKWECRIVGVRTTLSFDWCVQIDTFNLKKSTDIVGSRKIESRNDWLIDFEKTIEENIGEHSLNAIGFEVVVISDSIIENALGMQRFSIGLNNDRREFRYFGYFRDIGFSAGGVCLLRNWMDFEFGDWILKCLSVYVRHTIAVRREMMKWGVWE
ncbi:hypothetical protein Tco_0711479 [Tanacetum coccineum]